MVKPKPRPNQSQSQDQRSKTKKKTKLTIRITKRYVKTTKTKTKTNLIIKTPKTKSIMPKTKIRKSSVEVLAKAAISDGFPLGVTTMPQLVSRSRAARMIQRQVSLSQMFRTTT